MPVTPEARDRWLLHMRTKAKDPGPALVVCPGGGYSYVTIDRFQAFDVAVSGGHPRRLWVDGEPVASGGVSKEAAGTEVQEVKGTVKLEQGTHTLLRASGISTTV